MKYLLLIILCLSSEVDIIYGDLDYIEVLELDNIESEINWYNKSKSVAVIVPKSELVEVSENRYSLSNVSLKQEIQGIHEKHQFKDQISVGIGTAFLVAPNKIVTAGHLVKDLKKSVILFDYEWNTQNSKLQKEIYTIDEIYEFDKVICKRNTKNGDYALIKINKLVTDRKCLDIEHLNINMQFEIKMISCPDGTPLKLTNNGQIWNKDPAIEKLSSDGYFIHNLDNSGGSSGAPIFNAETGKVIGIQSGGDDNYFERDNVVYQVRGDEKGMNTNIGRNLSGEHGSKFTVKLISKLNN